MRLLLARGNADVLARAGALSDWSVRDRSRLYELNDGSRISRIVRNPGAADITAGIEFTVIEDVPMSPCTPPSILE
jgi:hypothetical protein